MQGCGEEPLKTLNYWWGGVIHWESMSRHRDNQDLWGKMRRKGWKSAYYKWKLRVTQILYKNNNVYSLQHLLNQGWYFCLLSHSCLICPGFPYSCCNLFIIYRCAQCAHMLHLNWLYGLKGAKFFSSLVLKFIFDLRTMYRWNFRPDSLMCIDSLSQKTAIRNLNFCQERQQTLFQKGSEWILNCEVLV